MIKFTKDHVRTETRKEDILVVTFSQNAVSVTVGYSNANDDAIGKLAELSKTYKPESGSLDNDFAILKPVEKLYKLKPCDYLDEQGKQVSAYTKKTGNSIRHQHFIDGKPSNFHGAHRYQIVSDAKGNVKSEFRSVYKAVSPWWKFGGTSLKKLSGKEKAEVVGLIGYDFEKAKQIIAAQYRLRPESYM